MNEVGRREELLALSAQAAVILITVAWWALALWPATSSSPAWLARTQSVCFGIKPNGLPDTAGWIGLIASPLGMFALLHVSARNAFSSMRRRLRSSRFLQLYLASVFVLATGGIALVTARVRSAEAEPVVVVPRRAVSPLVGRPAPALALVDQHGDTMSVEALRGRELLVTFAYAHCETVCPTIVHNALALQSSRNAAGRATTLLIVSLDPARDTPSRLPTIAQQWQLGADAHVLSGDTAVVRQQLDDWRIARSRNPVNGVIAHGSIMYEVDTTGTITSVRQ